VPGLTIAGLNKRGKGLYRGETSIANYQGFASMLYKEIKIPEKRISGVETLRIISK